MELPTQNHRTCRISYSLWRMPSDPDHNRQVAQNSVKWNKIEILYNARNSRMGGLEEEYKTPRL